MKLTLGKNEISVHMHVELPLVPSPCLLDLQVPENMNDINKTYSTIKLGRYKPSSARFPSSRTPHLTVCPELKNYTIVGQCCGARFIQSGSESGSSALLLFLNNTNFIILTYVFLAPVAPKSDFEEKNWKIQFSLSL